MSRVAIVTGASRGIGRATAIRLAHDFSAVAIVARIADMLAATADAARAAGAEPLILARDLREPEASEVVIRATIDRFGRIDALAGIAGAVPQRDLFELTDAQWDDGMALKFELLPVWWTPSYDRSMVGEEAGAPDEFRIDFGEAAFA